MNFKTTQKELVAALAVVRDVVAQKNYIPILQMFKFEVTNDQITITGSDSLSTAVLQMPVAGPEKPVDFLIDAQSLYEALKSFPAGEIEFSVKNKSSLKLKTITGDYELPIKEIDDFPLLEVPTQSNTFSIDSRLLSEGLSKTIPFTSSDDLREAFTGVCVTLSENKIEFAATDAHRLAYRCFEIKNELVSQFVLNRKAAEFMRDRAKAITQPIEIAIGESHVYFSIDNLRYSSRLIDAKYPAYKSVIPKDNEFLMDISKENLQGALSRVLVFSNQSTATISLDIKQTGLQLKAEDKEYAKSSVENIACNYSGQEMILGLNGKYLAELLKSVDGSEIQFLLSSPKKAAIIKESSESENLFLIMPTKLQ